MNSVKILDEATINKIAAGEVVERPASVVKELVENSLDAGASKIEVEIANGGISFIRVTDNGCGMSRENAGIAILRHATSKIRRADDINNIMTLGFRGEALPTIASVSRFSLLTRCVGDDLGTSVKICGTQAAEIEEAGCDVGTTIMAEDLFFNTPARKKFLKTSHTESSKINDYVTKLALAHPQTAFKFINNNKISLSTPGNGVMTDTILGIYGSAVHDALLELDLVVPEVRIKGYISKPSLVRSSRSWQTYIVNGRIIMNRAVAKAVENAYNALVPKTGYPFVVLDMTVLPSTLDVNVHPQKTEIKFEDEGHIFKAVYKAIIEAIRPEGKSLGQMAAGVDKPQKHIVLEKMIFKPSQSEDTVSSGSLDTLDVIPGYRQDFMSADMTTSAPPAPAAYELTEEGKKQSAVEEHRECFESADSPEEVLVPLGQVADCFIVAKGRGGLYIVDQHAAHERILYDKFAAMADRIPSQQLLVHSILDFSPDEARLIMDNREVFHNLGFDLQTSGQNEFRLREMPADIPLNEAENIIREILAEFNDFHNAAPDEIRQACIAMTACKAAIKAGDKLNLRQMEIILSELWHTAHPYTCPHGRPTILKFTSAELRKMFKRT